MISVPAQKIPTNGTEVFKDKVQYNFPQLEEVYILKGRIIQQEIWYKELKFYEATELQS